MKFALAAVAIIALAVMVSKSHPSPRQPSAVAESSKPAEPYIETKVPGDRLRVLELQVQALTARLVALEAREQ